MTHSAQRRESPDNLAMAIGTTKWLGLALAASWTVSVLATEVVRRVSRPKPQGVKRSS